MVAAHVPIYFGRVASLVLEVRDLTADQAEQVVERQARAFELGKGYLLGRWRSVGPASEGAAGVDDPGGDDPGSEPPAAMRTT
jgi:hypothetical protein